MQNDGLLSQQGNPHSLKNFKSNLRRGNPFNSQEMPKKIVGSHLFSRKKTSTSIKNQLGPSFFEGFASVFRAVLGSPVPTSDLRSQLILMVQPKNWLQIPRQKKPTVGYTLPETNSKSTWKLMIGRLLSFWGEGLFSGAMLCFGVCKCVIYSFYIQLQVKPHPT